MREARSVDTCEEAFAAVLYTKKRRGVRMARMMREASLQIKKLTVCPPAMSDIDAVAGFP